MTDNESAFVIDELHIKAVISAFMVIILHIKEHEKTLYKDIQRCNNEKRNRFRKL